MVHLGSKSGRLPGERLGYSQIMNHLYLWHKGRLRDMRFLLKASSRALLSNALRSLLSDTKADYSGRLRGNFRALFKVASGRFIQEEILVM
jgi:hypothetical protein